MLEPATLLDQPQDVYNYSSLPSSQLLHCVVKIAGMFLGRGTLFSVRDI